MLYHLRDPVAAIWKPATTTFDAEEASGVEPPGDVGASRG
jgi:hypothetical protein